MISYKKKKAISHDANLGYTCTEYFKSRIIREVKLGIYLVVVDAVWRKFKANYINLKCLTLRQNNNIMVKNDDASGLNLNLL